MSSFQVKLKITKPFKTPSQSTQPQNNAIHHKGRAGEQFSDKNTSDFQLNFPLWIFTFRKRLWETFVGIIINYSNILPKTSLNHNLPLSIFSIFALAHSLILCLSISADAPFDKRKAKKDWYWYLFYILQQAPPSQLIFYKLSRNDSNLESTILGIHFPITQQHFVRGKLKVIFRDFPLLFFFRVERFSLARSFSINFSQVLYEANIQTGLFRHSTLCWFSISSVRKVWGEKIQTPTTTPH